jgi:acetyl-CoA synthetase
MNDQYQSLYQSFRWLVPPQFNIADVCCHRWAESGSDIRRIAIYHEDEAGNREVWTYGRLGEATNQLANGLIRMGLQRGDRVAVVLGQRPETVVAHMAIYSVGAIVVPISPLINPELLDAQLRDAEARIAIVDHASSQKLLSISDNCPLLNQIIGIGFVNEHILPWRSLLARQSSEFKHVATKSSDPAMLLYKNDATDLRPKGTLLPHRALIGNLPGFVASQNWFPQPNDVFWSPADWASSAGLMNALLPTLYFGRPIVSTRSLFSAEQTYQLLERYQVTNTFLVPTAIRLMMEASPDPASHYQLALRAIMSAGSSLDKTLFEWCQSALGVTPNETFGHIEANNIVGNSHEHWPAKAGSIGRAYPGHFVAIINEEGVPVAPGSSGEIAVSQFDMNDFPDPVLFLGYWRNDAATQAKLTHNWFRTGDLARMDEDGYFWHVESTTDAPPTQDHTHDTD